MAIQLTSINRLMFKNLIGKALITLTQVIDGIGNEHLNRLFAKFLSFINLRYFPLVNYNTYLKLLGINHNNSILVTSERKGYYAQPIYIDKPKSYVLNETKLTDIYLKRFDNCCISGSTDVVIDLNHNCVISDFCYELNPNIMMVDGLLYRSSAHLCILRYSFLNHEELDAGIMISGKFPRNYYHAVFENIIRLLLLEDNMLVNIPVLIDEETLSIPSLKEIFYTLLKPSNRRVITLKSKYLYSVKSLYYLDHINYIVPHRPKLIKEQSMDYIYDSKYLKLLRERLLPLSSPFNAPKRIFVSRSRLAYRKCNEEELMTVLKPLGFEVISPQDFTLGEQIYMFNNADWIIGATGAAMTNLLFCKKNSNIICLGSSPKGLEPSIFNTIANLNGGNIFYVAPQRKGHGYSMHTDFNVNIEEFSSIINNMIV